MADKALTVDPEFEKLIPPPQAEELVLLEASLLKHGCRDALTTWKGILLDGHSRLRLCTKHGIPYRLQSVDKVATRDDAKIWIIEHQFSRRNLTRFAKAELGLVLEPLYAARAKEKQRAGGVTKVRLISDEAPNERRTSGRLAKVAHVSRDAIEKSRLIVARGSEEDKEKLRRGDVSINQVFSSLDFKLKQDATRKELEALAKKELKNPTGQYDVIECDPLWPEAGGGIGSKPLSYELMDLPAIEKQVGDILADCAAKDCHLFLWTTQKFLRITFDLLEAWGFTFTCELIWKKPGGPQAVGYPQYNHEMVLYARKGKPRFVDTKNFFTAFEAPRGEHSAKPEEFYDLLRRVTAGRRLALYARRKIEGFTVWGDQAPEEES